MAGTMRALILAVVAALVLVGCGNGGVTVANQDIPPAGTMWFGTAYDVSSFALTDRSDTFPAGQQIAVVAHMSSPPGNERVSLYMSLGGIQTPVGYTDFSGQLDLMAELLPAIYFTTPGQYPLQAKDAGGNVLSSATLTIR